ncbi:MAG: hypothetical protein HDR46_06465 [Bacteroides sp.]|nr:hypothetical protein [Bacteroides sp.]
MNLKSIVCSSLLLLSGLSASAVVDLVDGGVYRITNRYNSLVMTASSGTANVTIARADESNPYQLWLAERNASGSGYYLRALERGTYMTSPIVKGGYWEMSLTSEPDEDTMSFILNDELDNTSIQAHGYSPETHSVIQDGYAHGNGGAGTKVSCWGPAADASRWSFSPVEVSDDAMAEYRRHWESKPIEPNRVYQFVNYARGTAFMATDGAGNVTCVEPDASAKAQLWVTEPTADGSGYYFRNLLTGNYLNSPLRTGAFWTCTEYPVTGSTVLNFEAEVENSNLFLIWPQGVDPDSRNYAHGDDNNRLYSWGKAHDNSKWYANLVDEYDAAAVEAERAKWPNPNYTIEANRVYHITNVSYGHALTHNAMNKAIGATANADDDSQLWLAEAAPDGNGFILRNYESGSALMSSMATSAQWSVVNSATPDPDRSIMDFRLMDRGFVFEPLSVVDFTDARKTYGYAHEAAGGSVVCWNTNAVPTLWAFSLQADITEADIAARRQGWQYVVQQGIEGPLGEIFADKTCTILNSAYESMSVEQIEQSAAYLALPETLRRMVLKVRTGDWSETNPTDPDIHWDSDHAKKFRVQMIEPYSECDRVSNMTCIQAYTNLNNPTGIVADAGSTLYVMVEKGAADGSTLYMAPRTFADNVDKLNVYTDGIELHEGLNIVPCAEDGSQMVVYYTVSTNQGRTRLRPLTDFDDIKIHIEGGSINGFFNSAGDALYTPDTNDDWFYYRERARHPRFCLISQHCLLYLHFLNVLDGDNNDHDGLMNLLSPEEYAAGNFDLVATMKAWDDMFVAEQLVMGLMSDDVIRAEKAAGRDWYDPLEGDDVAPSDYSLYFNNRLMGISTTTGFMSATWYRTTYNVTTLRSIIMEFPTMDLWGPAHEFGHMNQGPMKIVGTTEESNNVFSNIALFYRGDKTSRASLPSVQTDFFNKGYNFHQHDTWGTTRMWFQLWLYYHATGHNKKFYPRLYELLRDNPLQKGNSSHVNAKDDLLHFAKMCCMAAGEDLTDFFESWGFFIPQDGFFIDDYNTYYTYLSEEDVAEWKAEVAALAEENGWEKNTSIIFIDDRVGSTKPGYANWCEPADAGTMGALKDFAPGADTVSGTYQFTLTGTTVTVSGATGGVGFIIYDNAGKLIGFANDTTFEVSAEAADKIAAGEATFNVVTGNNEEIKVLDAVREGSLSTQAAIIAELLDRADSMLAKADFTNRKVGYIKPELVADLKTTRDSVKTIVSNGELTATNAPDLFLMLNNRVTSAESIAINADNTIGLQPGGIYVFTYNKLKGAYGIQPAANAQTAVPVAGANVDIANESQQWSFITPADGDTTAFYIQSISTHKYMRIPSADVTPLPLSDEPQKFTPRVLGAGLISLAADITDNHRAIHADGNNRIVRWTTDADASQWTLELIDDAEQKAHRFALTDMIERSEALLSQAGTIDISPNGQSEPVVAAFPAEHFTFVEPEMMLELYDLVQQAKEVLEAEPTIEQLDDATEQLRASYSTLFNAMNRTTERLRELIDQTRTLADEIGSNSEEITPLALTADHYSTNAEYTGGNTVDRLSSWEVLFDNDPNTHFHSTYSGNTTDGLDHYITVRLPEPTEAEATHLILTYQTRNQDNNIYAPVEAVIEYSADGQTWTTAQVLDAVLPTTRAASFESETFEVPAATAFIRFTVNKNRRSPADETCGTSNNHAYFVVSEFGLATYNATSVPNTEYYPDSNEPDIAAALRQSRNSEIVLNAQNTLPVHYNQAYDALLPHYQTLLAIKENPSESVAIDEISASGSDAAPVIYNLQGRRVSRISSPGIYIVNGKKILRR